VPALADCRPRRAEKRSPTRGVDGRAPVTQAIVRGRPAPRHARGRQGQSTATVALRPHFPGLNHSNGWPTPLPQQRLGTIAARATQAVATGGHRRGHLRHLLSALGRLAGQATASTSGVAVKAVPAL
jgi:hypothetical protein